MQMKSSLFWDITQYRLLVTVVSGKPIRSIFMGLEHGTNKLSWNVFN
jgi:hypothetical protein